MEITIGKTELAGSGTKSHSDLQHSGDFNDQPVEYFRGDSVDHFDRGNQRNTIRFTAWREHANAQAAGSFIVDHAASAQIVDTITFNIKGGAVTTSTKRYMKGSCKITAGVQRGRSTFHTYLLSGGKIVKNTSELK